ncbi:MAG: c-type cytochrome [Chloroflexota bacterium]
MRSVHLLGVGLVVGSVALGATLAVMGYRWQAEAFPEQGPLAAAHEAPPAGTQPQLTGNATRGKTTFDAKCAGCHTIGGGKRSGPDLKGITDLRPRDWLVRMIVEPDKLIAGGDATAKQLVQEYGMPMPNLGVSSDDAGAVLDYLDAQSGSGGQAVPAGQAAAVPLPPGNPQVGRALFNGERPLANGGAACMGCHNAAGAGALGGGNWGLDLTNSQTRTGTAGLVSIMKSPPFPGMTEAFATRPLTDGEVSDLAALFVEMDAQPAPSPDFLFPLVGLGAFAILLGLTHLVWRGRARGVRRQLVQGGRR